MIKCLIVDDERPAMEILKLHIQKVPYLSLIASTTSPVEGIHLLNEQRVDLVFLDIRMPDMTGIDFIKAIDGKCKIILTTAFNEYAIDGYELDVVDYLLKPISFARFIKATQKARALITMNGSSRNEAFIEDNYIYVKTELKGKLVKIEFSQIDFIESVKNYAIIHRGNLKSTVLIGLKDLENILPRPQFWRIHKSYIVSTERIASIESNLVYLKGQENPVPLGESYRQVFLDSIKDKLI